MNLRATQTTVPVAPPSKAIVADDQGDGTRQADFVEELISRVPDETANGSPFSRRKQSRPTVSVVIPALNEELNLPYVLPKIGAWVDEVILVDGLSEDATRDVARMLLPGVRIVHQETKGKGA